MGLRALCLCLSILALPGAGQALDTDRALRAARAVAEVLLAADLAQSCPHLVRTRAHLDGNRLLDRAIVTLIDGSDLTMQDFAAAAQLYGHGDIARFKAQLLRQGGVDERSHKARCFYARRIAGTDHPTGRFLVPR